MGGDADSEALSEEKYLKNFFQLLSTFAWDKAKEYVEKKPKKLIPASLQVTFSTLAQNEKIYYSLEFLEQRSWFGRRDPLKNAYSTLQSNFLTIDRQEGQAFDDGERTLLSIVCHQLSDFCAARLECINMYMQIPKSSLMQSTVSVIDEVKVLLDSYSTKFDCPVLGDLKELFIDEMTTILSLYQACECISDWSFVGSVQSLQEVHIVLDKWRPILGKHQNSSFRSGFFGFGERTSVSTFTLYSWIDKFFKALVSKFTFYFYENMSQSASRNDELKSELKNGLSKVSYDFISKSLHFVRKNDVLSIHLLLDTREHRIVPETGYSFPELSQNPEIVSPVEDFTCVLTLPESSPIDLAPIKPLIYEKAEEFEQEKVVSVQSGVRKGTSFCAQVDKKIFFVVIFNQPRSEKDPHVASFFNDFLSHLKLKKVALLIKPGSK